MENEKTAVVREFCLCILAVLRKLLTEICLLIMMCKEQESKRHLLSLDGDYFSVGFKNL